MNKIALIISCEHAVNTVPKDYLYLFANHKDLLLSHRGMDFGALEIATHLNKNIPSDFFKANCTRLLVDCNRTVTHPQCFSEVTKNLPRKEKQTIIEQYYTPYREQVLSKIDQYINQGIQVLHLSIHSFTPMMGNEVRNTDVGLLYNPQRPLEKHLALQWKKELRKVGPQYKIRMNYPYKGITDGFTTALRKKYSDQHYLGIEVETNQALLNKAQNINIIKNIFTASLLKVIC